MNCAEIRELFAEAFYRELPDAKMTEFNSHLATCASCSREYAEFRQTLELMSKRERVEPTEQEWVKFTDAIEKEVRGMDAPVVPAETSVQDDRTENRPAERKPVHFLHFPSIRTHAWAYGAAAVLLVAFGIYMGRTFFNGSNGPAEGPSTAVNVEPSIPQVTPDDTTLDEAPTDRMTPDAPAADETTGTPANKRPGKSPGTSKGALQAFYSDTLTKTDREALAYLERSRNLLLGLTNLDQAQAASMDLGPSQRASRDLYNRGNFLAVALTKPSQQQMRQLVQGLQVILLQLANMEAVDGVPVVELVRNGVDAKSILLKINLEAIRAGLNADGLRVERRKDAGL